MCSLKAVTMARIRIILNSHPHYVPFCGFVCVLLCVCVCVCARFIVRCVSNSADVQCTCIIQAGLLYSFNKTAK